MNESRIRIRANRASGELEVEGPLHLVKEWWDKLWPELASSGLRNSSTPQASRDLTVAPSHGLPVVFGEFYADFRADISDVDKVLVAAAFVQGNEPDRVFTTKAANQLLLDQNIKVANASENVRRLLQTKRAFVVSDGKFRVSAGGFEHLKSLKVAQ